MLPVSMFVCLCLCSAAAASRVQWQETKTTFSPRESSAADGTAHSRRLRTVTGEDNAGVRPASAQAPWLSPANPPSPEPFGTRTLRRAVRKSDVHSGARDVRPLRTDLNQAGEPRGPGDAPKQTLRGRTCSPERSSHSLRQKQSAAPGRTARSEPRPDAPAAMAQEQDAPFGLNSSDYEEEYTLPDFPDATPFAPVDPRTRRKQLKNPFYPLTAEACGAYAVMITAAVIFSVGILGNVSVMCIVCHNYDMRSISNSLLASLALWDFVIIFFCLPLVLFHALTNSWLLGAFSCRIIPYLEVASLGVTTFTLCALCIDRFRAATNVQMYYEMMENWASTAAKLAVIWVGALLLALPELLIRQLVAEDDAAGAGPRERCLVRISTDLPDTLYVLGLTYDGARLWWCFGCYFCLPTLFTIGSSLATARKIRLAERACVRGGAGTGARKQIQLESQMNCAVVALAILHGVCVVPENICNVVGAYMAASVARTTLDVLQLVSQLLLFCKSAATPVLLFSLCRPFTRAFLDCCCCCCAECGTPPPPRSPGAASDTDNECGAAIAAGATELELSPFSTIRRAEASPSSAYTAVGTHC